MTAQLDEARWAEIADLPLPMGIGGQLRRCVRCGEVSAALS